jgi:hypothetical protein
MTKFERKLLQMILRLAYVIYNVSSIASARNSLAAKSHLDLMREIVDGE